MSRVASFLVKNHWEVVKIVFPCSVAFGFVYTMQYGSSPLADASKSFNGSSGDTIVRFNTGSLGGQRSA